MKFYSDFKICMKEYFWKSCSRSATSGRNAYVYINAVYTFTYLQNYLWSAFYMPKDCSQ